MHELFLKRYQNLYLVSETHLEIVRDTAALDAASWQPLEAADGVTDSLKEKFELRLDKLRAGEHLLVIRVYDQAGNAGLTKAVVR